MKILLLKNDKIRTFLLPNKFVGNVWITNFDENGNEKNMINVESKNNEWTLVSNNEFYVIEDSKRVPYIKLTPNSSYMIKENYSNNFFFLYCSDDYESNMKYYAASTPLVVGITIGKNPNSKIVYNNNLIGSNHAELILKDDKIVLKDLNSNIGTYVNDVRVRGENIVNVGDLIFIMGLRLIILKFDGTYVIGINNPNNLVNTVLTGVEIKTDPALEKFDEAEEEQEMNLYTDDDYFHRKPRFIYSVDKYELQVDSPPGKGEEQETPLILTLGPMMTMSLTSVVMIYNTIDNVLYGDGDWNKALPSLITSGAMLVSFLLWPFITNKFNRHLKKKKEKNRQVKYSEYIESKKEQILKEKASQEEILNKSYPTLSECISIIDEKNDRLWEKRIEDDDFTSVSLGTGSLPMELNIKFPDDHFTLDEDNLKEDVKKLEQADKSLKNVPIPFSLRNNFISAIIGKEYLTKRLAKNIILQLMTFHSYDNLKLVVFTTKEKEDTWKDVRILPHNFSNDKQIRYFASNNDEYKELSYVLEKYLPSKEEDEKRGNEVKLYNPSFVIITDSFNAIRNYDFIKNIVDRKDYVGFSLVILNEKISNLPDQCKTFIELDDSECKIFQNIANNEKQKFELDRTNYDLTTPARKLANLPIEINDDTEGAIPKRVGFLEMYEVGKVEQLNCLSRWNKNVPISNMAALVGLGKNGEKISLDLHEKFHGPHGLIAGMTGSGKSEFIITYILSMAVNYHPHEVQFILIDYKGGGLAGAFENANLGYKLPHLVGVITNLDKNEINRSLASIESELKRRQALFNKAREISGESTVDIYKYQNMYRNKIVDEPVSHLFIIADEFAELKTQQPEFMEQLISTARIGRSLGVHLILATQKPSGVVDSQIWSNTRFRVCLRVQEKADSAEVIQCPDAAFLTQTGRFYLQVGFNEIFMLGQSAYAGGPYIPSETIKKTIDSSINFVNNIGYITKTIETKKKVEVDTKNGEELINVVRYMQKCAEDEQIYSKPLWLPKIPAFITIDELIKKYNFTKENYMLNPVIGEYDVPNMQQQHLLTIPFYEEGNAIVFGMAGSGKENFITSMIYSSLITYTPSEVNYYILDFGAEILRYYDNCPIVGDICFVDDAEKIKNLYKMISDKIDERKKLFVDYNGDYATYCKNSGSSVPNIVVIINNYEAYAETYPDFDDLLIVLTRDCIKYGIYFVITCSTPEGMRFKLKQNFGQNFVLQQNNEDDYTAILGNVHKSYPSKIFGRGIIKKEDIYEYQTAYVCETEKISDQVKAVSKELNEKYTVKAPSVPVLPENVVYEKIKHLEDVKETELVVGLNRKDLSISTIDFSKNMINLVTSLDFTSMEPFIIPFIEQSTYKEKYQTIVINADDFDYDPEGNEKITYIDNNFDTIFNNITEYITTSYEKYKENNFNKSIFNNTKKLLVYIIGANAFKNKLSSENQNAFENLFKLNAEIELVSYIFIDSCDKIKNFEYEAWFKSNANKNEGIWIGNGIDTQYLLNVTQRVPEVKEEIPYNFCFVLVRGKPILTKFVESIKDVE